MSKANKVRKTIKVTDVLQSLQYALDTAERGLKRNEDRSHAFGPQPLYIEYIKGSYYGETLAIRQTIRLIKSRAGIVD